MPEDAKKLHLEIVKLLMQVAWADEEVSEPEIEHIIDLARDAELSDAAIDAMRSCLRGERRLPAPDLGFLREHRDLALMACKRLITSDERVQLGEREVFAQIKDLLS